jgi:putative endonuclease
MTVLERNVRAAGGEIDLVALDGDTLVIVEVKSRRSESHGTPEEAVDRTKRKHLVRAARSFLGKKRLLDRNRRYDVAAVRLSDDGRALGVRWTKAAFDEGEVR